MYATSLDLEELELLLRKRGDVDLLSLDPVGETSAELQALDALPLPAEGPLQVRVTCLLVPRNLPRNLKITRSGAKLKVDLGASSAIEFVRPPFDGHTLVSGRMYVQTPPKDADPAFLGWADRIFKATKKWMTRWPGDVYVAPDAAVGLKSGAFVRRLVGH